MLYFIASSDVDMLLIIKYAGSRGAKVLLSKLEIWS